MYSHLRYYNNLDHNKKKEYKQFLLNHGKNICLGILCRGKIKELNKFPKGETNCCECYEFIVSSKQSKKLSDIKKKVIVDKKKSINTIDEWKQILQNHKKLAINVMD
jgi:hypothetical protein